MKNIRFLVLCLFIALNNQSQASGQPKFTLPKDLESKIVKTAPVSASQFSLQSQISSNTQNIPTNIPNIPTKFQPTGFNILAGSKKFQSFCAKPGCLDPNCGPNSATPY